MRYVTSFALFLASAGLTPAYAEEGSGAFGKLAVDDQALSAMRGGFALGGGLDVSVAVQSDTRVNGVLLLRSIFVVDKAASALTVYGRTGNTALPGLSVGDRVSASGLNVSTGATEPGGAAEGLSQLSLSKDGASATASGGEIRVESAGRGHQVVLAQPTLDIRHLAGQAYGSIVANRGNDVTVDTVTNINIDLKNSTPFNLGSAMFRVEALAVDAATRLGR